MTICDNLSSLEHTPTKHVLTIAPGLIPYSISGPYPTASSNTDSASTLNYTNNPVLVPTDVLTTDLYSNSTSANSGYNYDNNSDGASCSSFISKPNSSPPYSSTTNPNFHHSSLILEQEDHNQAFTSNTICNDTSYSTFPLQPDASFTHDSISTINHQDSFTSFEQEKMEIDNRETDLDPVFTSGSQSTIRYNSNSAMKEDLDDSAATTTPDALNTTRKYRQKQKQREKQKEQRKKAWLQNSTINTHNKD